MFENEDYIDDWERSYIKDLKDRSLLAWSDEEAFDRYPKLQWLYNKKLVHEKFNPEEPVQLVKPNMKVKKGIRFPAFIKPQWNLVGLGRGARVVTKEHLEQFLCLNKYESYILTNKFKGRHLSVDCVVRDGRLLDWFGFEGLKDENGSFTMFRSVKKVGPKSEVRKIPFKKIKEVCRASRLKRGVINIELIGRNVCEVHLRPSLQFFDICGGLIEKLPGFMKGDIWEPVYKESTVSVIYRKPVDMVPNITKKLPRLSKNVRSIQLCFEDGKPLSQHIQDEFSYRWLVINGRNLYECNRMKEKIEECIRWKE